MIVAICVLRMVVQVRTGRYRREGGGGAAVVSCTVELCVVKCDAPAGSDVIFLKIE